MAAFAVSALETNGNPALSGKLTNSLLKLVPIHQMYRTYLCEDQYANI